MSSEESEENNFKRKESKEEETEDYDQLRQEYLSENERKRIEKQLKREKEREEERAERERERIERDMEKLSEQLERLDERAERFDEKSEQTKEKAERVREKAEKLKEKAKRINISVSPEMSEEWKDWSKELGSSVSELIRKSMKFVKNNIGDLKKLDVIGESFDKLGEKIELAVKESGIEELGEDIKREFKGPKGKPKTRVKYTPKNDKERVKKRVRGLIKLQKRLPIDKLAQALNRANEDAENLIYELVDEGIEGSIEEGVFKFTSTPEEVISKINDLIDMF
jgi:DNA repair exonuclease SbcCD ATPase subunit